MCASVGVSFSHAHAYVMVICFPVVVWLRLHLCDVLSGLFRCTADWLAVFSFPFRACFFFPSWPPFFWFWSFFSHPLLCGLPFSVSSWPIASLVFVHWSLCMSFDFLNVSHRLVAYWRSSGLLFQPMLFQIFTFSLKCLEKMRVVFRTRSPSPNFSQAFSHFLKSPQNPAV